MASNIFSEFEGLDLDRFKACLKAIRRAGVKPTKHTQYGLNPHSGNVWVWDEDWDGAVACSIHFDVAWYWSCPECGEEYNFATYAELTSWQPEQDELDTDDVHCPCCRGR